VVTLIVITTAPTTMRASPQADLTVKRYAVVFGPPGLTAPLAAGWTKVAGI
jgi:hypothetical protein